MGNYQLKLALMQPTFNPWIGYFNLINSVDTFVFLDTIQLNRQSWQTRNRIKVANKEFIFSIPVQKTRSKQELMIDEALLDFRKYDFRKKLSKTLEQNYNRSAFFKEVNPFIQELIFFDTPYLSAYNINIIQKIVQRLGIKTKIVTLSQTDFHTTSKKAELVLDVCLYFKTDTYITPLGAKEYLSEYLNAFEKHDITLLYQYYTPPTYSQRGDTFIPYLGIFDLLYNEGFENSLRIIEKGMEYA